MEIVGFENYLIYPNGDVLNTRRNNKLKHNLNSNGYYRVGLSNHSKYSFRYIHRLIAEYYIPNPDNKKEVDHINRNPKDNSIENLRWATSREQKLNKTHPMNSTGFLWIYERRDKYYAYKRKECKTKSSNSIPKLLCYSFFYLLKHPYAWQVDEPSFLK